jgi:hypothetical protein
MEGTMILKEQSHLVHYRGYVFNTKRCLRKKKDVSDFLGKGRVIPGNWE